MESDGSTMTNDKQNNNEKILILKDLRLESKLFRMSRQRHHYLLCTFLVLFVALFLVMTAMFVMEKRKYDIQQSQEKGRRGSDEDPNATAEPTSRETKRPRPTTEAPAKSKVCTTVDCILTVTDLLQSIDPRRDPCQNFYEYACNGWIKNHPVVPTRRPYLDEWVLLEMRVTEFIKDFLKNKFKQRRYSNVSAIMKSVKFYESCMNLKDKDPTHGKELTDLIHKYLSWPMTDTNWNETNFNLEIILARLSRDLNLHPFFDVLVQSDIKNSSRYMIDVRQTMEFGIFHNQLVRNYSHSRMGRKAYGEFIYRMSLLLGAKNATQTKQDTQEILDIERTIAKTVKAYYLFNEQTYYGVYKVSELMKQTGSSPFNWLVYFNELFRKTGYKIEGEKEIVVTDIEVIKKTMELLKRLPKRTVLNYLGWRIIMNLESYQHLSQVFYKQKLKFHKAAFGVSSYSLEDHCRNKLKKHFGMAVARVFVDEKFPGKSKKLAEEIGNLVKKVFQETLQKSNWMDVKSKSAAMEKVKAVWGNYGYPDYILDNDKLNAKYKGVEIYKDSIFNTTQSIISAKRMLQLELIKTKADRTRWVADPLLVNPSYIAVQNIMSFPSPFLQPPLYDKKYLRAVSYGGVGTIIAHELIHGFDNSGKDYDKDGNYVKWWSDRTLNLYKNRTKCLVEQYNNFVFEGIPLDGDMSLEENIADNVGVQEAFKAYRRYVKINGQEPRLPGTLFTNEQVFFLSYARNWCKNLRAEFLMAEAYSEYAPSEFRVNGPLQNLPEFSQVFKCPAGSYMNPAKKCSTW